MSARDVAIGDFYGDGAPDLAFANYNSQVRSCYIYWGDGKGGYDPGRRQDLDHDDLRLGSPGESEGQSPPGMNTLLAFVYWGGAGRDYGKHRRTLLKAASSSAVDTLDLDRDGWVDLVVSNHQEAFDHGAGTNIFWGSSEGVSWSRRSHLPTVGVHLDAMVDSGNVYDRGYQWDYLSPPLEAHGVQARGPG